MNDDSKVSCPICNGLFPIQVIERHCESCLDDQQIHIDEQLAASLSVQDANSPPQNNRPPVSNAPPRHENDSNSVIPPHLQGGSVPIQYNPNGQAYSPQQPNYPPSFPQNYPNNVSYHPNQPNGVHNPSSFPQNPGYYSQPASNPHYTPANAANTPPVYLTFQPPPVSPPLPSNHQHNNTVQTHYPSQSHHPSQPPAHFSPQPQPNNYPGTFYGRPENNPSPNYYSQPPNGYNQKNFITPVPAPPPMNHPNQQNAQEKFSNHYSNYTKLSQQLQFIQSPTPFIQQLLQQVQLKSAPIKEGWLWCALQRADASSYIRRWVVLNRERIYVFTDGQPKIETEQVEQISAIDFREGILALKFQTGNYMFFTDDTTASTKDWMQSVKIAHMQYKAKTDSNPEVPKINTAIEPKPQRELISPKSDRKPSFVDLGISFMNRVTNTMAPEELKRLDEHWVKALLEHPEEEKALVSGHLTVILTQASNHRFGKALNNFSDSWLKNAKRLLKKRESVEKEEFERVCGEVKDFIDGLISDLAGYYQELSEVSEQTFERCRESIEDLLFPKIYKELFELFKYRYAEDEVNHSKKMKELLIVNFAHLGIPPLFWLTPRGDGEASMQIPYHKAISNLQQLSSLISPNKKIDCLQETAKAIVSGVSDFYKDNQDVPANKILVGGDEFLPLFTYVLIRANVPYTFTEAAIMEFFISNKRVMEKGGYLVATLQTSLSFVLCLSQSDMEKSAAEILTKVSQKEQEKEKEERKPPSLVNSMNENTNPFMGMEDVKNPLPTTNNITQDPFVVPPSDPFQISASKAESNGTKTEQKGTDLIVFD